MSNIFFDSWESILRTIIISTLAYAALIILLRFSGKRTLSKMNAFDLVVTIALGSTLASVMLTKNVALADGVLAFVLLIGFQFLITFLSVRYKKIRNMVKATPALLAYRGELLHAAMKKERITEDEIFAVIREKGLSSLADAEAIVLETDGSLTVIRNVQEEAKVISSLTNSPDKK